MLFYLIVYVWVNGTFGQNHVIGVKENRLELDVISKQPNEHLILRIQDV
ncbi:hypothetical protein KC19_1G232500 [Ceratodon purpureus]|uniref:Uncharacterized protein n=1 Tax=Ceratodon purpureus TaxID=3225 RepID=A0A8T0J8G0_CERPU|nr:hypothetical protein KC19_1G232500 [Ceratodon purpureus]